MDSVKDIGAATVDLANKSSVPLVKSLRIGTHLLDLSRPQVMAILNVTPDSFYDGGHLSTEHALLLHAEACLQAGACILDVGGYSSRPGAQDISPQAEIRRIEGPLQLLRSHFPEVYLSVDTFRVPVAEAALAAGAQMINDISGGTLDKNMLPFVARHNIPYILMHMRGDPQTMVAYCEYEDLHGEIFSFLQEKLQWLHTSGASDVLIDPGFGFAKNITQNFALLKHLHFFTQLSVPLIVGLSRKSIIYKTLSCSPKEALVGTAALHMYALCQGAQLLRVHDVAEAQQVITLYEALCK